MVRLIVFISVTYNNWPMYNDYKYWKVTFTIYFSIVDQEINNENIQERPVKYLWHLAIIKDRRFTQNQIFTIFSHKFWWLYYSSYNKINQPFNIVTFVLQYLKSIFCQFFDPMLIPVFFPLKQRTPLLKLLRSLDCWNVGRAENKPWIRTSNYLKEL